MRLLVFTMLYFISISLLAQSAQFKNKEFSFIYINVYKFFKKDAYAVNVLLSFHYFVSISHRIAHKTSVFLLFLLKQSGNTYKNNQTCQICQIFLLPSVQNSFTKLKYPLRLIIPFFYFSNLVLYENINCA